MGYLDNSSITVDAILTKKGRQLLASGEQNFKITQFALADDEIDYDLWNPAHPQGSNYYGEVIENMPILEAFPDETQMMRSKLISLPKQSQFVPVVTLQPNVSSITLSRVGETFLIKPTTLNIQGGNETLGYTAILGDDTAVDLRITPNGVVQNTAATHSSFLGDAGSRRSVTMIGKEFELIAKPQQTAAYRTTNTIIGNETGGSVVATITVRQLTVDIITSNSNSTV